MTGLPIIETQEATAYRALGARDDRSSTLTVHLRTVRWSNEETGHRSRPFAQRLFCDAPEDLFFLSLFLCALAASRMAVVSRLKRLSPCVAATSVPVGP